MKTTKPTCQAPRRLTPNTPKAQSFLPKPSGYDQGREARRPQPKANPNDFFALCLYPGMDGHGTAA